MGNLVEKITSDRGFMQSKDRQHDLIALSRKTILLPCIDHIDDQAIYMEYIDGREGLTEQNALRAGKALRLFHDLQGYHHPCMTGLNWLTNLANNNLVRMHCSKQGSIEPDIEYPHDALIHTEPCQFIETTEGKIVFIDFEGIGMGSRYQDLGFIYYIATKDGKPEIYETFLEGYRSKPAPIESKKVKKLAGIISLAYANFAEFDERTSLGLFLLQEAK